MATSDAYGASPRQLTEPHRYPRMAVVKVAASDRSDLDVYLSIRSDGVSEAREPIG
jgi:hypothetical protein